MWKKLCTILAIFTILSACGNDKPANDPMHIKVGTISGPETALMITAKRVAMQKYGIDIQIVEFSDYRLPNTALANGSIDANVYQHLPYLQAAIKAQGYKLVSIGKTFIYPMGIYSNKINDLDDLPKNAIVAIPNDPSNEARALLLLQKAGVIRLNQPLNFAATAADIVENPKNLLFKTMDAAQLARILPDVSIAIINTNFALPAGLSPSRDAIYQEDKDSPYANIIVVRKGDEQRPAIQALVRSLQSEQVLRTAQQQFFGHAIPAW